MENKGSFTVLNKNGKFTILYMEKGFPRDLGKFNDNYNFESYGKAEQYIRENASELDEVVSKIKDEELQQLQKAKEEEEALELANRRRTLAEEEEKKKNKKKKSKKGFIQFVSGVLIAAVTLVGGHFAAKGISTTIDNSKDGETSSDVQTFEVKDDNVLVAKFREFLENRGIISCETMPSGRVVVTPLVQELSAAEIAQLSEEFFTDELFEELLGNLDIEEVELTEESKVEFCRNYITTLNIEIEDLDISTDVNNIATVDEELTTENFEELVANLAKPYVENNLSVSTEDLTKFTGIMLIDRLAEENPELVQELFSVQSEEEFLNDAGKVIGNTYMYNHSIWESEKSTENFIWISAGIPENDSQREAMELIEDYVKRMAVAAASGDAEEVNAIAKEFIEELTSPTGRLNALDDGTEFAAQIYIALMNNSIGRNYLNQEYRDYFNVRSTSETNISNILTVIRGCMPQDKTRSLGK